MKPIQEVDNLSRRYTSKGLRAEMECFQHPQLKPKSRRKKHFKIMELVLLAGKLFCCSEMIYTFTKLLCPRDTVLDKETMH